MKVPVPVWHCLERNRRYVEGMAPESDAEKIARLEERIVCQEGKIAALTRENEGLRREVERWLGPNLNYDPAEQDRS